MNKSDISNKLFCCILLLMYLFLLSGCEQKKNQQELKIGFSGCLTGKHSELGRSGLDGVILGIEEINADGGINGVPLQLLFKDDRNEPETARAVNIELINSGITVFIGHMTSGIMMATYDQLMDNNLLVVSPTASTDLLTGLDDNFTRMTSPASKSASFIARTMNNQFNITDTVIVQDMANRAYSQSVRSSFEKMFLSQSGRVIETVQFSSSQVDSWKALADQILTFSPQSVFLIANGMDAALLCQSLHLKGYQGYIFTSGWAKTSGFIENGGKAVEGTYTAHVIDENSKEKDFVLFVDKFKQRFGKTPDFAAQYGYEAIHAVSQCMKEQGTAVDDIKHCLLSGKRFQGPTGTFSFDKYGDPDREYMLFVVEDADFKRVSP